MRKYRVIACGTPLLLTQPLGEQNTYIDAYTAKLLARWFLVYSPPLPQYSHL